MTHRDSAATIGRLLRALYDRVAADASTSAEALSLLNDALVSLRAAHRELATDTTPTLEERAFDEACASGDMRRVREAAAAWVAVRRSAA